MKMIIKGKKKIQGSINISGSKNSAVAVIPAAILCDEEVILRNIPNITDCMNSMNILIDAGFSVSYKDNILKIKKIGKISTTLNNNYVSSLRGSSYFMGAYLGKFKKIKISSVGGCNLGYRPINYHINGFKKLNVKVTEKSNVLYLKTSKLKANTITLEYPSVGTTINLILASVKAKGQTIIENAATEPEVTDVCNFLISMGADISGLETSKLIINGVTYLHSTDYSIISDRIEAATYLLLGTLNEGSSISIKNINPLHLTSLIKVLEKANLELNIRQTSISVKRNGPLTPINITTAPYPGFPTDLGPLITVLMTQIDGESTLTETVFSNRFSHVLELNKMNANIEINNNMLYVNGISKFKASTVFCHDLRCGAALILAACTNRSTTIIENIEVVFRGYENILDKLLQLGILAKLD